MPDRPTARTIPPRALLLDAYGTLLEVEPPVPALAARLAAAGRRFPDEAVARAFAAEVAHYRAHHLRGGDPEGLAALRLECAGVLAAALGDGAPPAEEVLPMLVGALRFRPLPDAVPLLDAAARAGLRLGLVSNWDMSLRAVLDDLGWTGRFGAVCISAERGVAKPDPALFRCALRELGVAPGEALHCGDDPVLDGDGAAAAGVPAVLVDRTGRGGGDRHARVRDLTHLVRDLINS